ncbi:MAG: hypothetical protein Q8N79_07415, partial [Candidatus Methanoperedens sp.]|nr:hypothetical protein [Candidatus Methanoperedens sp.]
MTLNVEEIQKRFDEFQRRKKESILAYKDKINIVIYGAYNPPSDGKHLGERERLIKLRDRLREDGYTNTIMVEDLAVSESSCIPNLEKSLGCLNWADLNILVFTCRGKTDSVVRELLHAIDNPLVLWKCRIFEEIEKGIPAIGTLLKEELSQERYAVTQVKRENDDDLYEHVSSEVFQFLRKNIHRFVSR